MNKLSSITMNILAYLPQLLDGNVVYVLHQLFHAITGIHGCH
jgi:hypothetical protein